MIAFRFPESFKSALSIKIASWKTVQEFYCHEQLSSDDLPYPIEDSEAMAFAKEHHGISLPLEEWPKTQATVDVGEFLFHRSHFLFMLPTQPVPSEAPASAPASAPIAPFSTLLDDTSAPSTPERLILRLVPSPKSQRDSEDRRSQRNDTSAPSTPERLILRLVPSPKPQHDSEDRRSPRTPKTNSLFM